MSNTIVTPSMVAKEALRQLKNELVAAKRIHRGYEEEYQKKPNGWKIGETVSIKAPVYFRVKNSAVIDPVNLIERSVDITVSSRKHVAWPVTSTEMALDIDKMSKRFIKPAMQALANYIDVSVLETMAKGVPNQVGTPGTTPNSYYTFALAQARLTQEAVPDDDRFCIIDPMAKAKMSDHMKNVFHSGIVAKAIKKGKLTDELAGFEVFSSNNLYTHTNGTWAAGTCLVDDTLSEGDASFNIDQNGAGSAYTILEGDYFTIAAVNSVNPISGKSTGQARGFVIGTATLFADAGGGDMNATIAPVPGEDPFFLYSGSAAEDYLPYQNVSALPAENAAITVAGTTGQEYVCNMAFHRHVMALCMVPLPIPASAPWSAQESYEGITIRVIRFYDGTNDQEYVRFDVLYGMSMINPMFGVRIAG